MRPLGERRRRLVQAAAFASAVLAVTLTGCAQQPQQAPQAEYSYWLCREVRSGQRMDSATTAHNVAGITAAARDIAGEATQALRSLKRPDWPRSVGKEVTTLARSQAVVSAHYRAIGSAQSMTEIRRVPFPDHATMIDFNEANQALHTRLGMNDTCLQ